MNKDSVTFRQVLAKEPWDSPISTKEPQSSYNYHTHCSYHLTNMGHIARTSFPLRTPTSQATDSPTHCLVYIQDFVRVSFISKLSHSQWLKVKIFQGQLKLL